ncbi:putative ankyrin repeat protein [Chloropicon roscoffensis]|uniref:Ankyrin repeat protein n=1 Tax=Chloropicon roscoffensis TaxID=1461544 RepID=A0AAX4PFG3_9CHLO
MARAAGEPSAKRAKVDEAKEKEEVDRLVRRKEELVLGIANTRAEGMRLVREAEETAKRLFREAKLEAKRLKREAAEGERMVREATESLMQDLRGACADIEAENRNELLKKLPAELWEKIIDDENVQQNDRVALASTCRFFREKQKDLGRKLVTDLEVLSLLELRKSGKMTPHTLGWFQWVYDTMEILSGSEEWWGKRDKGAAYEGDLVSYAAFQGSVEILRWLMEALPWTTQTDWWAGLGGSVEVLGYVVGMGYEFDRNACRGAARGGCLEALKFLRGLDPPCRWDERTCALAAEGGHLEVLKWARSQDPPCPWDEWTCTEAAEGGHLEVLKWARSQDPPCPWNEWTCACVAEGGHLDVLKWARSQDPPCPWDERTCAYAAKGGHLEVLKWARSQDPPCPWGEETCAWAAEYGRLDVLKWARSQDPPCPWSRRQCRKKASKYRHKHVVDWIDQPESESDAEFSDSD